MQTPTVTLENADDAEDDDLWNAVLAHQKYHANHPNEPAEIFDSAEASLQATKVSFGVAGD